MLNLYVPFMIALNFAQRIWHSLSVTSLAYTLFFTWFANEEKFPKARFYGLSVDNHSIYQLQLRKTVLQININ